MPRITVDGIDYLPADPAVAVAITTHNRPTVLATTLNHFQEQSPTIPVIVVDDGSEPAVTGNNVVRNPKPLGIAAAKNRCLTELLKTTAEHFFLFDDDTYPACPDWWRPYTESPEKHLQHSWAVFNDGRPVTNMSVLHQSPTLTAYSWSMGCALYLHRSVVERVGGMRLDFGVAMHEHIEYSQRIHNAGLTTFTHQDVPNSGKLITASDRDRTVTSSIKLADRRQHLERNTQILESFRGSTDRVPLGHRNVVMTCLFTSQPDPQRPQRMSSDPALVDNLLRTLAFCETTVFCDFDTDRPNFTRVTASTSPYIQRWITYRSHLLNNPDIRWVWCVDGTDVENLNDPFPEMHPSTLYAGWENQIVGCDWMLKHHPASASWIEVNRNKPLLNAGVVGGDRDTMIEFTGRLLNCWSANPSDQSDMGYFNEAAHSMNLVTGPRITTLFKGNERSTWSLWKHK